MKKIIIAIDSFKGCLTSAEAGKAAEKGIKSINLSATLQLFPSLMAVKVYWTYSSQPLKGNI